MRWMRILPLQAEHLEEAAQLLAARHRAERTVRPELPAQFEEPEHAKKAVQHLVDSPQAVGLAAVRDGKLAGYLLGTLKTNDSRERHLWVDYAGLALAAGESAEVYRDLYAALAEIIVPQGYFKHYVLVPSGDAAVVDAWFRLGFGHEQVHAVMTLSDSDSPVTSPETDAPAVPDLTIRLAEKSDEAAIRDLAPTILQHQVRTPVFSATLPGETSQLQDGYAGLLDEADVTFWLAFQNDKPVGYQVFWPEEPSDHNLLTPARCISLGVGGTVPSARGLGIGQTVVRHGLRHAREQGWQVCSSDWRMTNLLSSRFWPKQGFQPVAYRLFRQIDPRIVWADGRG